MTTLAALFYVAVAVGAPQATDTTQVVSGRQRTVELEQQPWMQTNNAAGLSRIPISDHGLASASANRSAGNLHRPQEGEALNAFRFNADRFTNLGKYLRVYGSFEMGMSREYERAWSDVRDTYSGNPYIYGSDRKGDYDLQEYVINMRAATVELGRFTYGLGLRYTVGDLSRLRDPRPRNLFADYSLIPSATFRLGHSSTIGLDGYYRVNKHRLTGITTVEPDKFLYYDFQGMEYFFLSTTGTFKRQFVACHWGSDLQYAYRSERFTWLTSIGYEAMQEEVTGDKRSSPGRYIANTYSLTSALRLHGPRMLHSLTVEGRYVDANADSYKQQQRITIDEMGNTSAVWETLYSALVYRNYDTRAGISYRLYDTFDADGYRWYVGARGDYYAFENSYILPHSERSASVIRPAVEFGMPVFSSHGHDVLVGGDLGVMLPVDNWMSLATQTAVSDNVLVPDQAFFSHRQIDANLKATYAFPLSNMRGYVEVLGGMCASNRKDPDGDRTRRMHIGVSIGLLTR